jgi:hypothetical protein
MNGNFLEILISYNEKNLFNNLILLELKEIFKTFDADGSGNIDKDGKYLTILVNLI